MVIMSTQKSRLVEWILLDHDVPWHSMACISSLPVLHLAPQSHQRVKDKMQNIESLSYRELQKLAKEHGIPANQKRDVLEDKIISSLTEVETSSQSNEDICILEQEYVRQEDAVENSGVTTVDSAAPIDCDVDSTAVELEEQQGGKVSENQSTVVFPLCPELFTENESIFQHFESFSHNDLQKLAKEHGIPANQKRNILVKKIISSLTEVETSTQTAPETEPHQVSEYPPQLAVHSIEHADRDILREGEDEGACSEEEEVEEEQEDLGPSPEERIGCKLLGLATPVGKRQVFESPLVSKSGSKPHEKYNVHWRYEDYENTPDNASSRKALAHLADEEPVGDASPATRGVSECWPVEESPVREGQKLRGVATPVGKSIYFVTPNKSAEKEYLQYNVHWTYEDYLKSGQVDEYPLSPSTLHSEVTSIHRKLGIEDHSISSTQKRNPLASLQYPKTPGSAKKYGFVHAHP